MVKVSDYVMDFLADKGIKDVFTLAGGGAMHLLDSLGKHKYLSYIANHHEQAAAMSAEGYARVTGNFGVCLVSTGPATTNTLTGVECAWNDSIPVMFISGQANSDTLIGKTGLRQRGVHEANIIPLVSPITKYAIQAHHASDIPKIMETAYRFMMQGRKGPVWVDIPLDIQAAFIQEPRMTTPITDTTITQLELTFDPYIPLQEALSKSTKPVLLIGGGAIPCMRRVLEWAVKNNVTCVTTKNAYGYIPRTTKNYLGMVGINGNRRANYALQQADLLLVLGSRLSLPTTGYNVERFAPNAKKIIVDVDMNQIKNGNVRPFLSYNESIDKFMDTLEKLTMPVIKKCFSRVYASMEDIPSLLPDEHYVNSYYFYRELSKYRPKILVTDQGAAFYSWSQAFEVPRGGVSFTNGGFSPMGYGLPAAIGACVGSKGPVVCVSGDGGLELNIQELQTIAQYQLPIKLFVFDNKGYGSIKATQDTYFGGHYVGSDPMSGVSCVDACAIAKAYDIFSYVIENDYDLWKLQWAFDSEGPVIVKVILDPHQEVIPKVKAIMDAQGKMIPGELSNMYPYIEVEHE